MKIDINTKIIARLHTDKNGTGLNIYNSYFQDQGINAVYLLFQSNKLNELIDGIRNLNISGAITAGFEHDPILPSLVDDSSEATKLAQRVGIIINKKGVLKAHYQGGEGLFSAIKEKTSISGKRIVIVGSGTVATTLLLALENSAQKVKSVSLYNRTLENAKVLKTKFNLVDSVNTLDKLRDAEGDILINASRIGSKVLDDIYTERIVSKFSVIADVTFGTESTNLITLARDSKKIVVSGWDMFTHQASIVLKEILDHESNIDRLRHFVREGLSSNNHGAIPKLNNSDL